MTIAYPVQSESTPVVVGTMASITIRLGRYCYRLTHMTHNEPGLLIEVSTWPGRLFVTLHEEQMLYGSHPEIRNLYAVHDGWNFAEVFDLVHGLRF